MKKFTLKFLTFLYVLYLFGFVGLISGAREKRYNMTELFAIIACINVIAWVVTIKLII